MEKENLRVASGWVFTKFWDWGVVGIGVPMIYGLGVGALFGDEYIIAGALFFLAILWITVKALTWEETRAHLHRTIVSTILLVLGVTAFVLSSVWVWHKAHPPPGPPVVIKGTITISRLEIARSLRDNITATNWQAVATTSTHQQMTA